ncbi:LysR family transcriptional regulator [Bordetella genomosp. 7]|uniref:helix-turn-helix transcriptional regulator n=1 Tax=Bordetella genomosp. 7 TaxID=1416805 RepID=UPI000B9EDF9F|nr:substrate-binding domain-containing protein [Bordetella genomosp. 7]OZI21944.1 LysR family transcriptional regulator [Bordetella genomosp. 7]
MTYKFRVGLRPEWVLEGDPGHPAHPLPDMLALLSAIDATGNIAGACRACGLSYRHAWGILRRFETLFGTQLLITRRRQGTVLSPFAQRLLWANRRIQARLMPTLESLASELQEELEKLLPEPASHLRLHASHGFAVEALMQHMSGRQPGLELRYRTAIEALASLERGECDLAGFQVPTGDFEAPIMARYASWLMPDDYLLIHLAVRNTGLFVEQGNPKRIRCMADLARADVRFVNRQIGSSTRFLVEVMLAQAGVAIGDVSGYDTNEFTHMAIAAHIASGMADTGVGVETAAWRFGLDFIPLVRERYFFAIRRNALDTPAMQDLLGIMRGDEYLSYIRQLAGYDATDTGKLQTMAAAFPSLYGARAGQGTL